MERILYELLPPPASWSMDKVQSWTDDLFQMLEREGVRSICLPEVINESRDEKRTVPFLEKLDNLEYAIFLKEKFPSFQIIPSKICVRIDQKNLLKWVEKAGKAGIEHLILVGKESKEISCPGPTVIQASETIKKEFPHMDLGGITIFTRKKEAARILQKVASGIDFFISQIIFETSNAKCVLLDLEEKCRKSSKEMPRIFLSMAPALSKVDIEFMQWLGVEFPTAVWCYFMENDDKATEEKVFKVLELDLEDLSYFLSKTRFDIGFNIEQIMYKNKSIGERLLKLLKTKAGGQCL